MPLDAGRGGNFAGSLSSIVRPPKSLANHIFCLPKKKVKRINGLSVLMGRAYTVGLWRTEGCRKAENRITQEKNGLLAGELAGLPNEVAAKWGS